MTINIIRNIIKSCSLSSDEVREIKIRQKSNFGFFLKENYVFYLAMTSENNFIVFTADIAYIRGQTYPSDNKILGFSYYKKLLGKLVFL